MHGFLSPTGRPCRGGPIFGLQGPVRFAAAAHNNTLGCRRRIGGNRTVRASLTVAIPSLHRFLSNALTAAPRRDATFLPNPSGHLRGVFRGAAGADFAAFEQKE